MKPTLKLTPKLTPKLTLKLTLKLIPAELIFLILKVNNQKKKATENKFYKTLQRKLEKELIRVITKEKCK